MSGPLAKRVLLVGWDAADWKVITPLLEQGLMPALEGVINCGVMGNLATLNPVLSPMLWNSIATGKRADKHGIHGFAEPDPNSGGIRPVSSTSRKVKAIWNILTQRAYKTHVLGWFAGHPAEPINGISVSDLYPVATAPYNQPWPLPPGTVHPEAIRQQLSELRVHPAELDAGAILPFVPQAATVDQGKDKGLATIARLLAENCCIHNAATWILQTQPWDFLAVYYNGIDHFSHAFMHFHPPRLPGIPEDKFELYKDVVKCAYRFHDLMLNTLLELAGPDATVIICSDHGFHSDNLRPRGIPDEPTGPAVQHRQFGIVCMKGAGVKQDERIYGATLLDITPTILTLFGLPIGDDMDGRVLVQAFDEPPLIERIASWEEEPGESGMHPEDMRVDADSAQAVLNQFAALGYIAPTDDQKKAVESAQREAKFNLAQVYMDKGQPHLALKSLEDLYHEQPEQTRFAQHLAQCYFRLRRIDDAKRVLADLMDPETAPPAWVDLLTGIIQCGEGNMTEAVESLLRAERADPRLPDLYLLIGQTYLRLKRWDDAERAFHRALDADSDSSESHVGLAQVMLARRKNESAVEEALNAVSLQHFLPMGHFFLGVGLARLGHFERATLALETAVAMLPGFLRAHRWLAAMYNRPGADRAKSAQHRQLIADLIERRKAEFPT